MLLLAVAATHVLAVLELKDKMPAEQRLDAAYVSDQVRVAAKETLPDVTVITRENMVMILSATGKDLAGCESECEVETGRRIGADAVVSGELLRFGTQYKVNLKLHDTRTGELLSGAVASGASAEELEKALKPAVQRLLEPVTPAGAQAREIRRVGFMVHGAVGYADIDTYQTDAGLGPGSATGVLLGVDVTYRLSEAFAIGPFLEYSIAKQTLGAQDVFAAGGLVRWRPAPRFALAGGIAWANYPGSGIAYVLEADVPVWSVVALHGELFYGHDVTGIGFIQGNERTFSACAGLAAIF